MIKLFATTDGLVVERDGRHFRPNLRLDWNRLFTAVDPFALLEESLADAQPVGEPAQGQPLLGAQEVWAAGVTYWRSRSARMEEAKDAGGATFYDKVYSAERPELFFKATAHRVVSPGQPVRLRRDSRWNVPEPELTLAVNAHGRIFGYTIGNDMSSRDIEGENPLYLPQAKVYDGSAALGPCLLVTRDPLPPETEIRLEILRAGAVAFEGSTQLAQIKRTFESLVHYLFRDQTFPFGCYLMTGTGVVPPDHFTLQSGDEIRISVPPIGRLINPVA